jgi:hypothetical protein
MFRSYEVVKRIDVLDVTVGAYTHSFYLFGIVKLIVVLGLVCRGDRNLASSQFYRTR